MTKEEALRRVKGYLTDYIPVDNYEEVEEIVGALEQGPILDKPHIEGDYMQGYKNGLRTAEWRYSNAIKEIREHADRLKDSLRHALDIIDKYKVESEE